MANEGSVISFNRVPNDKLEERRNWQTLSIMLPVSTFTATRAPTVNDDITQGWRIGSRWINTSEPAWYQCVDNTTTVAVWQRMVGFEVQGSGSVGGGDGPDALEDNEVIRAHTDSGDIQGSTVKILDGSAFNAILDPSGVSADRTFTFPNSSGTFSLVSGTEVTASAVIGDNRIVRGDGGVRGIQSSGITIDDSDNVSSVLTIAGKSGSALGISTPDAAAAQGISLSGGNSTSGNNNGGTHTIQGGAGIGTGTGGEIQITAGSGGETAGAGGPIRITGGDGGTGGNGGSIELTGGIKDGAGTSGVVKVIDADSGFASTLATTALSANRVHTLPNAAGTFSLEGHVHSAADLTSGIIPDARMPNLTGDVTTSEGAVATTLATKYRRVSKTWHLQGAALAVDAEYAINIGPDAVTIETVRSEVDAGTVDFDIEERAFGAAEDAGTVITSSDIQAADGGTTTSSFSNAGIAANAYLTLIPRVITTAVELWVTVTWIPD